MVKRLMTSFFGLILFFFVLLFPFGMEIKAPNALFSVAVFIITMIAIYELHKAITKRKELLVVGWLMTAVIFIGNITNNLLPSLMCLLIVYLLLSVIEFGKEEVKIVYMLGFATAVYSTFISTIANIKIEFSVYATFLPFVLAWITDSGAYFVGCSIGKHKLIPKLSPKKTVEGAIGGIIACVLVSLGYVWVLDKCFDVSLFNGGDYQKMLILSFVGSLISQLGDFASSAVKREFNVKDYGNILPGHGGVLDRFDSIIFVAPFVYYILTLLA